MPYQLSHANEGCEIGTVRIFFELWNRIANALEILAVYLLDSLFFS